MSSGAATEPASGRGTWLPSTPALAALGVVMLLAALVRGFHITDPIAGYHAFNEAFYLGEAVREAQRGLGAALLRPLDANNPPLYTLTLMGAVSLFGASVTVARWVTVGFALLAVLATFVLARLVYNERIGVMSAAVLAFMPGFVLVGRNIQTEALLVFLQVASLCCYVAAIRRDDPRLAVAGGVLLGLGLLTKMPALLVLPTLALWETWRGGLAWLRGRRPWYFLAGALAGGAWWHLWRVVSSRDYGAGQSYLAGTVQVPSLARLTGILRQEAIAMVSPLLALLVVAAVAWMLYKRQPADRLVLSGLLVFGGFFLFYNFHTYYLVPAAPFAAIAAARLLDLLAGYGRHFSDLPREVFAWAATALLCAVLVVQSFVTLAGNKYVIWSPAELVTLYPSRTDAFQLAPPLQGGMGPVFEYYLGADRIVPLPATRSQVAGRHVHLIAGVETPATPERDLPTKQTRLVVFGREVWQLSLAANFFVNDTWHVRRVGEPWQFGFNTYPTQGYVAVFPPVVE